MSSPKLLEIENLLMKTRIDFVSAFIKSGIEEPQTYIDQLPTMQDFSELLKTYQKNLEQMLKKNEIRYSTDTRQHDSRCL